jgi:hypothetical protein
MASAAIVTGNVDLSPVTAKFGRAYPFARTPTPVERAALRSGPVFHYSPPKNLSGISQPGGNVLVNPSRGNYRNALTPGRPDSAYFFQGRPSVARQQLNMLGAASLAQQAEIAVSGADLPRGTLIRATDRVVVVPGGYTGPGAAVAPGEQLSLPLPGGGGTVAKAVPPTRPPGMAGAAVASVGLGLFAASSQQRQLERQRDSEGYAPAGAAAFKGLFDGLANYFTDPSMRTLVPSASRFNFSMWRENVRRNAAATPIGDTFTMAWQIHEPPALGGDPEYTGRDVLVEYERVSETEWRARVPAGGRVIDGTLHFGEEDGGRKVPRLDVILTASDHEAECELNRDLCA